MCFDALLIFMWPFTSIISLGVSLLLHLQSRGLLVVYYRIILTYWYRARSNEEKESMMVQHGEDLKLTQMGSD